MKLGRVTIDQANKLKQLGFDIPAFTSINFVPEIALVENWLEKEYGINLHDWRSYYGVTRVPLWCCDVYSMKGLDDGEDNLLNIPNSIVKYKTKEEAISAAIDFTLDYLLKQNRNGTIDNSK